MPVILNSEIHHHGNGFPSLRSIGRRAQNVVKFYVRPAKDIAKDLFHGYDDYPFSFREMLQKHGSEPVRSIVIVRTPLSSFLSMALNVVSLGEIQRRIHDSRYESLFHLQIIINGRYSIEKQHTITFSESSSIPPKSETQSITSIPGGLTIAQMMENTKRMMGRDMFAYNALHNNCQAFISAVLRSNGMAGYDSFVKQDVASIFEGMNSARKIVTTVTNIANHGNQLTEGSGLKRKGRRN